MKDPDRVSAVIRNMIANGSQRLQVDLTSCVVLLTFQHSDMTLFLLWAVTSTVTAFFMYFIIFHLSYNAQHVVYL